MPFPLVLEVTLVYLNSSAILIYMTLDAYRHSGGGVRNHWGAMKSPRIVVPVNLESW